LKIFWFLLLLIIASSSFASTNTYGAIAYSPKADRIGAAYNYSSQWRANKTARKNCGYGCKVVARFQNACGALATTSSGSKRGYAGSWSKYKRVARVKARIACDRVNGNKKCYVRRAVCSWGYGRSPYSKLKSSYSKPKHSHHKKSTSSHAGYKNKYGAIAYNPVNRNFGFSRRYKYQFQANIQARKACGKGSCKVVVKFKNACGALALGISKHNAKKRIYAGGWGVKDYRARINARKNCYRYGASKCWIVKTVCSK